MKTTLCKYCGATIHFIETRSGGWMPVDTDPVAVSDLEPGDVFVTSGGNVVKYDPAQIDNFTEDVFVSHFATCPQADLARRQRSNAKRK